MNFLRLGLLISVAQAQCSALLPQCKPILENYHWDGRYWRAEIYNGETARMYYTFFSDIVYRVVACGKSDEGKALAFRLLTLEGRVAFDSQKEGVGQTHWDFSFSQTQPLMLEIYYPQGDGCGALLIGYKAIQVSSM